MESGKLAVPLVDESDNETDSLSSNKSASNHRSYEANIDYICIDNSSSDEASICSAAGAGHGEVTGSASHNESYASEEEEEESDNQTTDEAGESEDVSTDEMEDGEIESHDDEEVSQPEDDNDVEDAEGKTTESDDDRGETTEAGSITDDTGTSFSSGASCSSSGSNSSSQSDENKSDANPHLKSKHGSESSSLNDDLQEEYDDYKVKKCYYPVLMEDFYNKRYSVIRKIGWGHFSTVWLSYDIFTKRFVALKIVRAGGTYCETAEDEIKLGKAVDEGVAKSASDDVAWLRSNVIRVLDHFDLNILSRKHICITFDLLGQNLLDLINRAQEFRKASGSSRYGAVPLANVRSITEKILRGLKYLHENCRIIHTDVKPENILISVPERSIKEMVRYVSSLKKEQRPSYMMSSHEFRLYHPSKQEDNIVDDEIHRNFLLDPDPSITVVPDVQVKIADLGNACWVHKKFTDEIQTKEYRALESIVVADYGTAADMWSVACVAFESATGDYIFPCHRRPNRTSDEDHLLLIIERCARAIPKKFALSGRQSRTLFKENGQLICCPDISSLLHGGRSIKDLLISKHMWTGQQAQQFAQFLMPMLEYDPHRRATASGMLRHPWMTTTHIHAENHLLDTAEIIARSESLNAQQSPERQFQQKLLSQQPAAAFSFSSNPNGNSSSNSIMPAAVHGFQFHPPSPAASSSCSFTQANNNNGMQLHKQIGALNGFAIDGTLSPTTLTSTPSPDYFSKMGAPELSNLVEHMQVLNGCSAAHLLVPQSLSRGAANMSATLPVVLKSVAAAGTSKAQRFISPHERNSDAASEPISFAGHPEGFGTATISNHAGSNSDENYHLQGNGNDEGGSFLVNGFSASKYGRADAAGKRVMMTPTKQLPNNCVLSRDAGDVGSITQVGMPAHETDAVPWRF